MIKESLDSYGFLWVLSFRIWTMEMAEEVLWLVGVPARVSVKKVQCEPMFCRPGYQEFLTRVDEFFKRHKLDFEALTPEEKFDALRGLVKCCRLCPLHSEARRPVPPIGPLKPEAVVVGRNPGRLEDRFGVPFYPGAPGGALLDKYLGFLGFSRQKVYITNAVQCYTTNDRPPEPSCFGVCSFWKAFEFSLLDIPRYFFLLGNDALRLFMGMEYPSIMRIHGEIYYTEFRSQEVYLIPVLHPGQVLRQQNLAWDVVTILRFVRENLMG